MPKDYNGNNSNKDELEQENDLLGDIPSYEDIDIVTKPEPKAVNKDYNLDDFIIGQGFEVKGNTKADTKAEPKKVAAKPPSSKSTALALKPSKNGKNKKKKKMNKSSKRIILSWVAFVVVTSLALAYFVSIIVVDALALDKDSTVVAITITEDQSTSDVSQMLEDNGLINHPFFFTLFAKITNSDEEWQSGTYEIPRSAGYFGVSNRLKNTGTPAVEVEVIIDRADTVQDIATKLNAAGVCDYNEFMEAEENYAFQNSFVKDIPKNEVKFRLEGYLYPDKYYFYAPSSPEVAIAKMLDNFEVRLKDSNLKFPVEVDGQTYTLHEMVTLGSIIETECNGYDADMANVSQVFHNRLNWEGNPRTLGSTPTADYVGGEMYDTNKIEGLPPGAICNPTIGAIEAACKPNEEYIGYYYFVTDSEFKFYYNKTYDEHNATIQKLKDEGKWAEEETSE